MSGVAIRIRKIRESAGLTQAQFAQFLGESPHRIRNIEGEKQRAPEDFLARLVLSLRIDGTWLLTGLGGMYREGEADPGREDGVNITNLDAGEPVAPADGGLGRPPESGTRDELALLADLGNLEELREALGIRLFDELGLGNLGLEARLGSCPRIWRTLVCVERYRGRGCTLTELVRGLHENGFEVSVMDAAADLLYLLRQGLVVSVSRENERLYLPSNATEVFHSQTAADVSGHALEAITQLARAILPSEKTPQRRGSLVTAVVRVKSGEGVTLKGQILEQIRGMLEGSETESGGELVNLVIGLSVTPEGA